jgi:predicted dehydrogenase
MATEPIPSTSPLRGALVGFGNVAVHAHLPVWLKNKNFRIDAVVEPRPERAGLAREFLPEARIYPDLESLVKEHVPDFVDICTPPCFHGELIYTACMSGMHVFCEKPLVGSLESLQRITEAAEASHKVVFVVDNWKHAPLWTKVMEVIRENKIGTIQSVSLSVLRTPGSGGGISDWRRCSQIAGGGILLDHGWHNLYLVLSLIKARPLSITAKMETDASGLEDRVDLVLRFPHAEANLLLTWRAGSRRNFGTIRGEQGTLSINDDHLVLAEDGGRSSARYQFGEALSGGSHHLEWMVPVVENFHREILGLTVRGTNLTEAKWCAYLSDLAYRSHRGASCSVSVAEDDLCALRL